MLHRLKTFFYCVLPLVFVGLSLSSILQKSPTYDETIHLFAGYSYLKWGDFRVNPEHPPLVKMLAALPLLALDLDTSGITPRERYQVQRDKNYGWVLAHRFIFANNDADSLFLYARVIMVALAVALALCVARWTWELYGVEAAIIALFLFCLDPNLIAHSSIVQTDFPFALFFFSASYFFWRSLNNLTWHNLLMTATLFALAAVTKFSAIIILPIWLVLGFCKILNAEPLHSSISDPDKIAGRWGKTAMVAILLIVSVSVAYLATWIIYQARFDAILFQRGKLPAGDLAAANSWSNALLHLARQYMFLPEALLFGLSDAYQRMERTAFLLGEISRSGFWLYFPVAFLSKTPLPTLVLVFIAVGYCFFRPLKQRTMLFLLAPPLIFFCFAVWSRLNVGWRHILPIYPFLFVWTGGVIAKLWRTSARSIIASLGVWLCVLTASSFPNYLAYFNEAVGGSAKGSAILVDSNLDWGQDLKGLKTWMTENRVEKIQLAYFGTADPAYYKIDSVYLPGSAFMQQTDVDSATTPRYIAISETFLAGLYLDRADRYAQFRGRKSVANIGYSIRVYEISDQ